MDMTNERLDELEKLANSAFAGPWEPDVQGPWVMGADNQCRVCDIRGWGYLTGTGGLGLSDKEAAKLQDNTTTFIAASRTAIPDLIAALREHKELFCEDHADDPRDVYGAIGCVVCNASKEPEYQSKKRDVLREQVTALQARVKALESAGEKMASFHHDTCSSELISGMPCSCGKAEWDRAVKGVKDGN